jgi:hypothetical protein
MSLGRQYVSVDRQPQNPVQHVSLQQHGQYVTRQSRHLCRLPTAPEVYHHPDVHGQQSPSPPFWYGVLGVQLMCPLGQFPEALQPEQ